GRLADLLERRPEGGDELGREVVDESHRVGEQNLPSTRQLDSSGRRVERGEELVLGEDLGTRNRVEQRALAGVGVADQRDDRDRCLPPALAVTLAMLVYLGELPLDERDTLLRLAPVGL